MFQTLGNRSLSVWPGGRPMPRSLGAITSDASSCVGYSAVPLILVLAAFVGPQETVSFPTEDGGVVYADVYGTGRHGVVLAHGGRFTKESWEEQAPILAEAGFRVIAIDFRGRGRSHAPQSTSGHEDVHFDVLAAVRYLHETGATQVSVVGASFGGGAAAEAAAAASPGEIDRIVLIAHSSIDHPEQMKGRKLFITARDDTTGSGALRLPSIREQFERAQDPKEMVVLDGSAHAQFIFQTDQGPRLLHEMIRFLSEPD